MSRKKILLGASLLVVFQVCELVAAAPTPGLDLPQFYLDHWREWLEQKKRNR